MTASTLAAALRSACERFADRPALVDADDRITYGVLWTRMAALADGYARMGIRRGDRIVCALPNGTAHLVATGAAWSAGAVHVAADPELTVAETTELIGMTGARALLHTHAPDAAREIGRRRRGLRLLTIADLTQLVASGHRPPAGGPAPDDVAAIFTTSGTTGRPKLPLGLHGKLHASWTGLAGALDFGPTDVHLAQLPLSHGFGLMLATAALLSGGRLVLLDGFTDERALEAVAREHVSVFNGTPAHFRLLTARLRETPADIGSLRIGVGAGAAFEPPLLETILTELEMELMLMYGSSEGVGVATRDREDILAGSVGRPDPEGSVAILDAGGRPLAVGQVGEIAFARAFNPVRYWGEAQARAEGWYRSGDLGRLDETGRLHVVGRIKHQINRGGLKIDPAEVEAELLRCRGVSDGAVVGLPNPILDEVVCACVVPAGDARPTLPGLRAELSGRLAAFKLPEELCLLERMPRTPLGKIDHERLSAVARRGLAGRAGDQRAGAGAAPTDAPSCAESPTTAS